MKNNRISLVAAFGLAAVTLTGPLAADENQVMRSDAALAAKMREVWDAQVTWTRMYVVSTLGNLPDSAYARARLFACPGDIGRQVEAYYGRAKADSFAQALRLHLLTLTMFVEANKAGNGVAIDAARQRWRADAESIAAALGRINPAWSAPSFRELLDVYLQLTDREVTLRARGNYPGDIANFGELHETAVSIAEVVSQDILKQFPVRSSPGGR